ncbi:MAG: hypothetical protein ACRD5H_16785 [Nitrososphaerales archaeon]
MESLKAGQSVRKTKLYETKYPLFDDLRINDMYLDRDCETCMLLWSDICRARDSNAVIIEKHMIRLLEQHLQNEDTSSHKKESV